MNANYLDSPKIERTYETQNGKDGYWLQCPSWRLLQVLDQAKNESYRWYLLWGQGKWLSSKIFQARSIIREIKSKELKVGSFGHFRARSSTMVGEYATLWRSTLLPKFENSRHQLTNFGRNYEPKRRLSNYCQPIFYY